tara:strand:+ start:5146 stop:6111 length:966 start_codon:yes stop_codon:yes gene_type:complete
MIGGKNVLVAGGTGLVGANLARRLGSENVNVLATFHSRTPDMLQIPDMPGCQYRKFDFTSLHDCIEATRNMNYVFICAAQTFGAKIMKENPTALIVPNLQINSGLLEACRMNAVERVVFISSSTVYQEAYYPIREDELDLNRPTYELYMGVGWMNRYIEQLAKFYYVRHGLKIGIVRPTNIYGPYDKFDDDKSHVLPALIKRAVNKEEPYVVWGDGYTVRDFIYVEDFVDALISILKRYCMCDPVNVSSGSKITIRDAVKVILEVCGHSVNPQYDVSKPNAIPYRMLNTNKFESIFGERAQTEFYRGIQHTVEWYKAKVGH